MLAILGVAYGDNRLSDGQHLYDIDIPSLNAAEALNQLAEQTGAIMLFPYNLAEARQANAVAGQYTLMDALDKLLQGSGLTSGLSDKRVIQISLEEGADRDDEKGNLVETNTPFRKKLGLFLAGIFVASGPAGGQESGEGSRASELEEIIVTAARRETRLQDTAMSISVITASDLQDRGVTAIGEFLNRVPGVFVSEASPGKSRITMRGISTDSTASGNATTAAYLDEYPMGLRTSDVRLIDVSRVEVLKGPQGTLYGQSAMGGVIRYITNRPTTDGLFGGVNAYVSQTEASAGINTGVNGYVNIPISDTFAARLVGYTYFNDGFVDVKGKFPEKDANTEETLGGRIALQWDMTESTTLGLVYLNQQIDTGSSLKVSQTFDHTPNITPVVIHDIDYSNPMAQDVADWDTDLEMLNLKLDVGFDAFDLSVMASKRDFFNQRLTDQAGYLIPIDAIQSGGSSIQSSLFLRDITTVEARLVSNSDGFIEWIAGIWWEDYDSSRSFYQDYRGPDTTSFGIPISDGFLFGDSWEAVLNDELAIYGEVGFHLTDKSTLTLGYRRSDVEVDTQVLFANGAFDGSDADRIGRDERVQEDVNTFKVDFKYELRDDVMLWALASSGYRPGGFNGPNPTIGVPASSYQSDTLWNYEIGTKSSWFDNRLVVNASIFRIDWEDIQLRTQIIGPGGISTLIANSGSARINGLELEADYHTDRLSVGLNYAYTDAELLEDAPAAGGFAGDQLPASAKHVYSILVDYVQPISNKIDLAFRATHRYVDSRLSALGSGDVVVQPFVFPSYQTTDLRLTAYHENGFDVSLFADNIFNEYGITWIEFVNTHTRQRITGPRIYGLSVNYNF